MFIEEKDYIGWERQLISPEGDVIVVTTLVFEDPLFILISTGRSTQKNPGCVCKKD